MSYRFGLTRRVEASQPSIVERLDRLAKQVDSRLDFIAAHPPGSDAIDTYVDRQRRELGQLIENEP